MAVLLNPYIHFRENAREAMQFYQSVFGGDLTMSTFGESGADNAAADGIMHAMLVSGPLTLMGADTPPGMETDDGARISISLSGDDEPALRGYWDRLSASGQTIVALEVAPWGDVFGMCLDGYGVEWLVNITGANAH